MGGGEEKWVHFFTRTFSIRTVRLRLHTKKAVSQLRMPLICSLFVRVVNNCNRNVKLKRNFAWVGLRDIFLWHQNKLPSHLTSNLIITSQETMCLNGFLQIMSTVMRKTKKKLYKCSTLTSKSDVLRKRKSVILFNTFIHRLWNLREKIVCSCFRCSNRMKWPVKKLKTEDLQDSWFLLDSFEVILKVDLKVNGVWRRHLDSLEV